MSNKQGRRKLPESQKHSVSVRTKLTLMEYEIVKTRAERNGISIYEYIRRVLLNRKVSSGLKPELLESWKSLVKGYNFQSSSGGGHITITKEEAKVLIEYIKGQK